MSEPRRANEGRRPRGRRPVPTRAWWTVFVALVLVVALVGAWLLLRPRSATPGDPAVPGAPAATPTPTPTPSIPEIARKQVWTSDTKASGTYQLNTLTLEPKLAAPRTVKYVVKVEDTTEVDADEAAREVQRTFDDERGWAGYGKRNFTLVNDEKNADLTIYIAAPATANKLCQPLDIESKWNCRVGERVVLNSDRWRFMTPTYDDLAVYRNYLVNHEVGHFLGQGHVGCPAKGATAPVMMQQSIELDGCTANAWPKVAD